MGVAVAGGVAIEGGGTDLWLLTVQKKTESRTFSLKLSSMS